jgi:hypothetical protein
VSSYGTCLPSNPVAAQAHPRSIRLKKVVTSPTYDPTGWRSEPGVEQPDLRLGEAGQAGTFEESELEYAATEGARDYGQPFESGMGSSSTVETAKE